MLSENNQMTLASINQRMHCGHNDPVSDGTLETFVRRKMKKECITKEKQD